ncbi:MAG: hypothetical protein Sapg2KO_00410 [Saprospiraceae bacterium]
MSSTQSEKRTDLILLILRIPFLVYFVYEVFAKDEVSKMGYFAAFVGFSIAAVHSILRIKRRRQTKKAVDSAE